MKVAAQLEICVGGYERKACNVAADAELVGGEWVFENFESSIPLDTFDRTFAEEVLNDLIEWHRKVTNPGAHNERSGRNEGAGASATPRLRADQR